MPYRPVPLSWFASAAVLLGTAALLIPEVCLPPAIAEQETPTSSAKPADRSTPEAALKSFVDALNQADLSGATSMIEGATPGVLSKDFADELRASKTHLELSQVKIYTAGEDEACAVYSLRLTPVSSPASKGAHEFLILKRINGTWAIASPTPDAIEMSRTRDGMFLETVARLLRYPEQANEASVAAKMTLCKSNVKQLALALIMYSQDYDERFPAKAATYKSVLLPYLKDQRMFRCPLDGTGPISYTFNERLARKSMASLAAPAATVMVYEGKNGKLDFRHNGGAVVGFADGHVKLVMQAEAAKLRWTP